MSWIARILSHHESSINNYLNCHNDHRKRNLPAKTPLVECEWHSFFACDVPKASIHIFLQYSVVNRNAPRASLTATARGTFLLFFQLSPNLKHPKRQRCQHQNLHHKLHLVEGVIFYMPPVIKPPEGGVGRTTHQRYMPCRKL